MSPEQEFKLHLTRRQFFSRNAAGIGGMALASLLDPDLFGGTA